MPFKSFVSLASFGDHTISLFYRLYGKKNSEAKTRWKNGG